MRLNAAIHPPVQVLVPVAELVAAVGRAQAPADSPKRGFLHRRGGRTPYASQPRAESLDVPVAPEQLDRVPVRQMSLPVAGFGNVTSGDAARLARALGSAAAESPVATLRIAGGTALEFPEDRSVWARLEGDLDGLRATARGVTQVVEQLGFFVDRRKFRPWLRVATVKQTTTASHLEAVVAALEAFAGEPWTLDHVSLMKTTYDRGVESEVETDRFPLARP